MKWTRNTYTTLPIEWSAPMAYIVGLTATDGCLISGRRAINFKSADKQLIETYLRLLGRTNQLVLEKSKAGTDIFHIQFSDARLYLWFQSIGLTPRKSLTLSALDVPDEFLAHLVRGLLDGDGNITNHVWKADTTRRSGYYYEWLRTRFASASRAHLEWLKERIGLALGLRGWIWYDPDRGNGIGALSYGKHDSIKLLKWLYADPAVPCVQRKRAIWDDYQERHADWVREPAVEYTA